MSIDKSEIDSIRVGTVWMGVHDHIICGMSVKRMAELMLEAAAEIDRLEALVKDHEEVHADQIPLALALGVLRIVESEIIEEQA